MRCKRCLMTDEAKGVDFKEGVCNLCREEFSPVTKEFRAQCLNNFYETIEELKKYRGEYNCLVAYSGGKDSSYLLYLLKYEYGLRPLAVTVDTGFLNPNANENISAVVKKMHIDHIFIRPDQELFNSLYRYFLTNMVNIAKNEKGENPLYKMCLICAHIMDIYLIKSAIEKKIPVVFIGLSPDEIRMAIKIYGDKVSFFYEIKKEEFVNKNPLSEYSAFLNPELLGKIELNASSEAFPRILLPFHVLPYDPEKIRDFLQEKGLIDKKKSSPYASNCLINWIMIYSFTKRFGYNPYMEMFSDIVRDKPDVRLTYIFIDNFIKLAVKLNLFKNREINHILKELKLNRKEMIR